MLSTPVAILAAVALLMPGFIIVELALARSARGPRSDLELTLRALGYTLVVHLLALVWTAWLVRHIGSESNWPHHVGAIALYIVVVLLVVPILLGGVLNTFLAHVERQAGRPSRWAAALGAGASRDAFDYAFQRLATNGAWVICELVGHTEQTPRIVGGIYGAKSAIGQTPSPHDIYLEALCTVARDPHSGVWTLDQRIQPDRGMYIAASQIARIDILPEQAQPG
jgi:Family of unknown function (DUF6338)